MRTEIDGLVFDYREESWDPTILEQVVRGNVYKLPDRMDHWNVLDIGGHIGSVALMAAQRGASHIFTFEPQRESFCLLHQNIRQNQYQDRIVPFNLAVGVGGLMRLYHHRTDHGSNSLQHQMYPDTLEEFEWVWSVTLEQVMQFAGMSFDYLKLDCEGSELYILPIIYGGWHTSIRRIGLEMHLEESNSLHLNLLLPYYHITEISQNEFQLEHK